VKIELNDKQKKKKKKNVYIRFHAINTQSFAPKIF